jgi:hypothetical protein
VTKPLRWPDRTNWTNVRPIAPEREREILDLYAFATAQVDAGWTAYVAPPEKREPVTIICGRCGQPHTYLKPLTSTRRRYCNHCVRT